MNKRKRRKHLKRLIKIYGNIFRLAIQGDAQCQKIIGQLVRPKERDA